MLDGKSTIVPLYTGIIPINVPYGPTPYDNLTRTGPSALVVKHDEDKLEELFWEFDSQSQYRDERLVFKEMLRGYATYLANK